MTLSFATGVAFCYFLMLPFAIAFLGGFQTDIFDPIWSAERFLDFVSTFLFWVGITFELPIVMYFLSKMGIVSAKRMASFRKYAFVMAFVIGAIITPTPDPDQPDHRESADLLSVRAGRDPGEVCMTLTTALSH